MSKKNILHLTLRLDFGGLEKIVYQFVTHNDDAKYAITVCALDRGGYFYEKLRNQKNGIFLLNRKPGKFDFRVLKGLVEIIRKKKIHIVHSHSGTIFYSVLAGKLSRVEKIVHTEHGRYRFDDLGEILEDKLCSRFVNNYVVVSRKLYEYMLEVVKINKKKLGLVVNGVDLTYYRPYNTYERGRLREKWGIGADEVVLGFIGRLVPEKNVIFLVDWFRGISRQYDRLRLLIVGDGFERDRLESRSSDLPGQRMLFTGAREDIPDLLNMLDIFVLPSLTEGTSLTILEAMATGLPVVASDVGGNGDLVSDGETGFLFKVNDMGSFDEKMRHLLSNRELRERMGLRGRELVEKQFSLQRMIDAYYQIYSAK